MPLTLETSGTRPRGTRFLAIHSEIAGELILASGANILLPPHADTICATVNAVFLLMAGNISEAYYFSKCKRHGA